MLFLLFLLFMQKSKRNTKKNKKIKYNGTSSAQVFEIPDFRLVGKLCLKTQNSDQFLHTAR